MAKRRTAGGKLKVDRRNQARVYILARRVLNQDHLNEVLLDIDNRLVRREVFHLLKPMLKFDAVYPEHVAKVHRSNMT